MNNQIMSPFKVLIKNYRYKTLIRSNISKELEWINHIIEEISCNIENLNRNQIKSNIIYIDINHSLSKINSIINNIYNNLTIRGVSYLRSFIIAIKISKIRLNLIKIIENVGCCRITDIIKLLFNENIGEKYQNDKNTQNIIKLIDKYYKTISIDIFQSKNNEKFNTGFHLDNESDNDLGGIFKFSKLNSYYKNSLPIKLSGCKIYVPLKKKLIILSGYFSKSDLDNLKFYDNIELKKNKIQEGIKKLKINNQYKTNYLNNLSILDVFIYNTQELIKNCNTKYNELKKIKNKNITLLIKEFINMDIDKQRELINILLLNNKDNDNLFIAYILFDLLNNSKNDKLMLHRKIILDSFNWKTRKILNDTKIESEIIVSNISKYGDDIVPLEKRILLMRAPNYVKSKALDKLKEINNSKGGENNVKAMQYIEGLLKIPFGIFKQEPIMAEIDNFKFKFNTLLQELGDYKKIVTYDHKSVIFKNDIDNFLRKYKLGVIENDNLLLTDKLNKLVMKDINKILTCFGLSRNGKKKDLIKKIINNKNKLENIEYSSIVEFDLSNSKIDTKIFNYLIEFENEWDVYKKKTQSYLDSVDDTLENCVYGMKDAKQEIKRIVAQWINGNNKGYIFGFEGPPGTGKTTLAKNGIANCLKDIDNVKRPFCFIPLGGSTNGSTLEGHNYTYVGSTWGRIVDCIIESKCMNPIIYIDELDKISKTEHGKEIIGILVHLTDPSQNEEFMDKYFSGIKIDLSKCLIVFSYNNVEAIDKILLDRIHRIPIKLLNKYDKCNITRKFLLPQICNDVGVNIADISIDDATIFYIINNYTYEAGVRKLKECLYDLIRDINLNNLLDINYKYPVNIDIPFVKKIFYEKNTVFIKKIPKNPSIGIVNGLYATNNGTGGITTIETYKYLSENKLSLELTGQQGDIMKESMKVAKTIAWNLLPDNIKKNIRENDSFGIHIHCPEAATPKDGPSAGVGITIALISLLSCIPVNNKYAVTGEIDLNGNVLPIGGLESKIDGAICANVEKVICPKKNIEDVTKIINSEFYKKIKKCDNFEIIMVDNILEVIDLMLLGTDKYKFSQMFNHYYNLNLGCEEYLLMFKNLCDKSQELICITDASPEYKLLYSSKKFNELLGDNNLDKSLLSLVDNEYHTTLETLLKDTKNNNIQNCARIKCSYQDKTYIMLIKPRKVDNIISYTIKLETNDPRDD